MMLYRLTCCYTEMSSFRCALLLRRREQRSAFQASHGVGQVLPLLGGKSTSMMSVCILYRVLQCVDWHMHRRACQQGL